LNILSLKEQQYCKTRKDIRTKIAKEVPKWNPISVKSSGFFLKLNFLCINSMEWLLQKSQLRTIDSMFYRLLWTACIDYRNEISKSELMHRCKEQHPKNGLNIWPFQGYWRSLVMNTHVTSTVKWYLITTKSQENTKVGYILTNQSQKLDAKASKTD